ncbi:MAG: hypothetical protein K0S33_65 [Bacteroidetes bacterium]|jgi:tetratricopeptide (TPR) repeat protein|nr:hypothetical protein [Bacteroidota bacterium]
MKTALLIFASFISFQVYCQKSEVFRNRADSAWEKGNVSLSLQLYSKAIKSDTTNAYLYIRRGICFKYLDNNKSAISDLTKGLQKSTLLENKL